MMENNNELYHHGVLGMKWGQHRFQNKNGSLTTKGKNKFTKVEASSIASKMATRRAKKVYSQNARNFSQMSNSYSAKAVREAKKSNKYAKGTEANKKHIAKSKEYTNKANEFSKIAKLASKRYSDIKSGKLKAGKDFIVQRDTNIYITKLPAYKATYDMMKIENANANKRSYLGAQGYNDYTVIMKNGKK